jgi:hypothetical protein
VTLTLLAVEARAGTSTTNMSTSWPRRAAAAVDAAAETSPDVAAMTRAAAVLVVVAAGLQAHHLWQEVQMQTISKRGWLM